MLRAHSRRSTGRQALQVLHQVEPTLKCFKKGSSPVAIYTQVGGPQPLRKLAKAADVLWVEVTAVIQQLASDTGCPLGVALPRGACAFGGGDALVQVNLKPLEAAAEHAEMLLERARRSMYWPNDKSARSTKFHADGNSGAVQLFQDVIDDAVLSGPTEGQLHASPPSRTIANATPSSRSSSSRN